MRLETTVLGHPLRAELTPLDDGLHVLLTGGCRTHVGAVTLADPGLPPRTLLRETHRDDVLSTLWASALADALRTPTCVACGIRYDNAAILSAIPPTMAKPGVRTAADAGPFLSYRSITR